MESHLVQYGYIFIFLGSILEGDATLLTASFLAHRKHFHLPAVIAVASAATILFNQLVYFLARSRGRAFLERKVGQHHRYCRVRDWIQRRSVLLLLFSRYIFGFRLAIPAACGMSGMSPLVFAATNAAGAALWAIPLGIAGYLLGEFVSIFWSELREYDWHIAVAALAILWTTLAVRDPELRRVHGLFLHTRAFALRSLARVRHRQARGGAEEAASL
jgi:membrane protein DedA with SNARE-associated domain